MMNEAQTRLMNHIVETDSEVVTACLSPRALKSYADDIGVEYKHVYSLLRKAPKVDRGSYDLRMFVASDNSAPVQSQQESQPAPAPRLAAVSSTMNEDVFVPKKDQYFIRWGNFKDIETIIKSGEFYPTFITGLSGNGKTVMVEQACARANRQYIRVQITPETDEDDLIGGFRLVDGETVFQKGPVVKAMESGAILLIDEIDRGSNKIMCLQGVLEGKPIMIKKTGEMVAPAKGFNVVSTANTKGQGSEDGRFVSASIIDEAFLERFIITVEQPYPGIGTERRIIKKHMEKYDCMDEKFAELLVSWSDTIRKTFEDGGVDEQISTRRLCHIVQTFSIFGDRRKAVELCVNRFDEDTKDAFIDLYSKVDATVSDPSNSAGDGSTDDYGVSFDDMLDSALNN
jgi:MoxR-like ATPase